MSWSIFRHWRNAWHINSVLSGLMPEKITASWLIYWLLKICCCVQCGRINAAIRRVLVISNAREPALDAESTLGDWRWPSVYSPSTPRTRVCVVLGAQVSLVSDISRHSSSAGMEGTNDSFWDATWRKADRLVICTMGITFWFGKWPDNYQPGLFVCLPYSR